MSVTTSNELAHHLGHRIVCVLYGDGINVAIECETCWTVLISFDLDEEGAQNAYEGLREHVGHKIVCRKLASGEPAVVCKDCGGTILHRLV